MCGFYYRGIELLEIEKTDLPNMHKIVPELEKTQAWSGSPFKYSYSWKKSRTWVNSLFRQGFGMLLVKQKVLCTETEIHTCTHIYIYNCLQLCIDYVSLYLIYINKSLIMFCKFIFFMWCMCIPIFNINFSCAISSD